MPAVVPHQHPTQRAASTDVVECVDRAATRRHAYDCTTASVIRRIAGAADCNCGRRGPVVSWIRSRGVSWEGGYDERDGEDDGARAKCVTATKVRRPV